MVKFGELNHLAQFLICDCKGATDLAHLPVQSSPVYQALNARILKPMSRIVLTVQLW